MAAEAAKEYGVFEKVFAGTEPLNQVKVFLYEAWKLEKEEALAQTQALLRQFGWPSLAETVRPC